MSHCTRFSLSDQQKSEIRMTMISLVWTTTRNCAPIGYYMQQGKPRARKFCQAWPLKVNFPFLRQILNDFSPEHSVEVI